MTAAQRDYLAAHGIDPYSLSWADAQDLGVPAWATTEAALLPDGRVLLAHGRPAQATARPSFERATDRLMHDLDKIYTVLP